MNWEWQFISLCNVRKYELFVPWKFLSTGPSVYHLFENLMGKDHLSDQSADEKIIWKWFLQIYIGCDDVYRTEVSRDKIQWQDFWCRKWTVTHNLMNICITINCLTETYSSITESLNWLAGSGKTRAVSRGSPFLRKHLFFQHIISFLPILQTNL
jgi:hypothetical protein